MSLLTALALRKPKTALQPFGSKPENDGRIPMTYSIRHTFWMGRYGCFAIAALFYGSTRLEEDTQVSEILAACAPLGLGRSLSLHGSTEILSVER